MNETPNILQWLTLQALARALAQLRFRVYDLYIDGGFVFVESRSCDDDSSQRTSIINLEGEVL